MAWTKEQISRDTWNNTDIVFDATATSTWSAVGGIWTVETNDTE
jgi:hypothetical protein